MKGEYILLGLGALGALVLLSRRAQAQVNNMILSGTYQGTGNIYSPENTSEGVYFSGWFNDQDYPDDAVYLKDNQGIVSKVLQVVPSQLGDPIIRGDTMYLTYAISGNQNIGISYRINGIWQAPIVLIPNAWLPAEANGYLYYTKQDKTNSLMRMNLSTYSIEIVTFNADVTFPGVYPGIMPVNVDTHYDGTYWLMGDYYTQAGVYSIGLWKSLDGINFDPVKLPLIQPDNGNIIARTPYFEKTGNLLKVWYAQQKMEWWTNAIYYKEVSI